MFSLKEGIFLLKDCHNSSKRTKISFSTFLKTLDARKGGGCTPSTPGGGGSSFLLSEGFNLQGAKCL